jgi:LPS-assembly protein
LPIFESAPRSIGWNRSTGAPALAVGAARRTRKTARGALAILIALGLSLALPAQAQDASALADPLGDFFSSRQEIRVQADRLQYLAAESLVRLDGNVKITASSGWLRADHGEMWLAEKRLRLYGRVRLVRGKSRIQADQVVLDRERAEQAFFGATLVVQEREPSLACVERGGADCGRAKLVIRCGRLLQKKDMSRLVAARFTPCDCGPDEAPTFEVGASRAELEPGEGAWLSWPVFYAKGVPVLGLPGAYLPLSQRRSGFLFPQANYSGRDGFVLSESLFLTLGRSADATASFDFIEERGMRERLEFRAAPAHGAWARAEFAHIADGKHPVFERRFRLEADAAVRGPLQLAADIRLFSDSDQSRDFASDLAGRSVEEARSSLRLTFEGDEFGVEVDAGYHQDLRRAGVDLFSHQAADTIHRLGAATVRWRPRLRDLPALGFDFLAEAANFSALGPAVNDAGWDGEPGTGDLGEADGLLSFGEVRRALRIRAEPVLTVSGGWRFCRFFASASHRQLVYLPHGTRAPAVSSRGLSRIEAELSSELSRVFGDGGGTLAHVVHPRLNLVGLWPGAASGPGEAYFDEQDRWTRQEAQLVAAIDSDLYTRAGRAWERCLRLSLFQAVDLERSRIGQSAALARFDRSPLELSGWLSLDPERVRLTEVEIGAAAADGRGDRLRLGYRYLPVFEQEGGSRWILAERMNREAGVLAGLAPNGWRIASATVHFIEGQATLALGKGLALSQMANVDLAAGHWIGIGSGISYRSPCRCLAASLDVRFIRGQTYPDVFFLLDLAMLGSAGGGTAQRF